MRLSHRSSAVSIPALAANSVPPTEVLGEISDTVVMPLVRAHHRLRYALMVTCGCGLTLGSFGFTQSRGLSEFVRRFTDPTSGW